MIKVFISGKLQDYEDIHGGDSPGPYESQNCRGDTVSAMIENCQKELSKKIWKSRASETLRRP